MALLPENSTRKVEDGQLELEDVLGVASAKVRDRTSLDDHAADPRVAEPASKGAADEPPVDQSLLVDAGEIRRIFRSNDPRKEKWDAGIRKELKALTEDTPCLVPLTPKQRQVAETKARTEGKPVQRVPSKLVFAIKTDGRFRVRLVACGNHCAEVLGCVSTSELDGVLLRFMLSWEDAQRTQGSAGRTVEKVDVSNAFINSDLPENRLVLIDPPSLLISLGYLPQGTVWVAKRAIYGLRESPALWAATRNKEVAKLTLGNGLLLRPSRTHAALWFLYYAVDEGTRPGQPDENGELVTPEGVYHYKTYVKPLGMIGVYVDDILGVGLAKAVREAMEQIRLLWKTTPIEALSEHGELSFLGTWVSERLLGKELGFYIHQLPFAEQLVKRVSADGAMRRRDTPCEPESYTGRTPETPGKEFSEKEKAAEMHRLQSLVGSLTWLSCRTRPDLAYGVSMAASMTTKSLEECHQRTRHLVQYLATHLSEGLFYRYGKEGESMDIYGDASFAPGGSASRTGWILCLGSHALTWGSQRQTLVAAQPMLLLLEEVQREVRAELRCDNAAAIAIMRKEELSLRTRHLSIRAEYLRSLPANISVSYTPTGEQKADILTKGLAREMHRKACQVIGMQGVNADLHPSLTPSLSERREDATRQCSHFAQPGMASIELAQSVSGRSFGRTVLSKELSLESSVGRTFGKGSEGRTSGDNSVQRTFETVLSGELSVSSSSPFALAAEHADIRQEQATIMTIITSAQYPPAIATDSESGDGSSDGDSSDSVFFTRTTSSHLASRTSSNRLVPATSSSLSATSSTNPFGSRMTSTNNEINQVKNQVEEEDKKITESQHKEPEATMEAEPDFGNEEEEKEDTTDGNSKKTLESKEDTTDGNAKKTTESKQDAEGDKSVDDKQGDKSVDDKQGAKSVDDK